MKPVVEVKKYIMKFGFAYIIGLVALLVIVQLFDLNHSPGVSIGVLMGAAYYAVGSFIQDNKRTPNKKEKTKMVLLSFITSCGISSLLVLSVALIFSGVDGLSVIIYMFSQFDFAIVVGSFVFMSFLYLLSLYFSYGFIAQKLYDGFKKKGKI
ncbi:ABZJ_00895 family protein [Zooshikella ganghwensis]|uniref:ABZJ_00895 family protein n=1 Tax=Zooshikella ganghwensis TaxID=202772 RepID=UPI0004821A61|nr:ABZJ_00895 family protein [Zooshikella ganghwensis]